MMKRYLPINVLLACLLFGCAGLCSCSSSEQSEGEGGVVPGADSSSFSLHYVIPDTERAESRAAVAVPPSVPAINPMESKVEKVSLLFFERDDYGNGIYQGLLEGALKTGSITQVGEVTINFDGTKPTLNNDTDYDVLVIANAADYITNEALDTYCTDKSYNRVKQLQAKWPVAMVENKSMPGYYASPTLLLMSGEAVKLAGKDLSIELLRAAVRIDVKVADDKKNEIILTAATLRNVSPHIPLFSAPMDKKVDLLSLVEEVEANKEKNYILGGLYLSEVFRTEIGDDDQRSTQSACLMVNCRMKGYEGKRTWYRVDINFEKSEGIQYLRRNNAYTVVISNIKSLGAETIEAAYQDKVTLIKTITIPTGWLTPEGVTPPQIDLN